MNGTQEDCQIEIRVVFEKLNLLKETSQRQLSDIIDLHSGSLIKGINDLFQNVSDLQNELLGVKVERNALLQTVDKLSSEIRQLNTPMRLTSVSSLPIHKEQTTHAQTQDTQDKISDAPNLAEESVRAGLDIDMGTVDNEDKSDTDMPNSNNSLPCNNDPLIATKHIVNEGISNMSVEDKTVHAECSPCELSFSSNQELQNHLENIHDIFYEGQISVGKNIRSKEDLQQNIDVLEEEKCSQNFVSIEGKTEQESLPSPRATVTPTLVNRWGDKKPPLTVPGLITLVLEDLPNRQGTLQEIYGHITKHFPFYANSESKVWHRSISHALSVGREFIRRDYRKKGGIWTLAPGANKAALMRIKHRNLGIKGQYDSFGIQLNLLENKSDE